MVRVLVTGGTGFVGIRIVAGLIARGAAVRLAVRRPAALPEGVEAVAVGEIGPATDWTSALDGTDAVVHAAARVHVMKDTDPDPLSAHRRINALGSGALAAACVRAGVGRLLFLSSVKVMGEETSARPWTEADRPAPVEPYGVAKWEGERLIADEAAGGLRYVILRPPLVYGPGVRGNFLSLLKLCASPVPLPLGAVTNRRSLIFVDNLADAVVRAVLGPGIPDGAYFVADGPPVSTALLIRRIRHAMGRPTALIPIPPGCLAAAAGAAGKRAAATRLLGNLEVDDTRFRAATGWVPPVAMDEAMARTVKWFRGLGGR